MTASPHEPYSPDALNAIDRRVGAQLAYLRKLRGVSQTELADHVGISFQQIQKYERAANRISASRLYAFAERLGVGVAAFFEELTLGAPDTGADAAPFDGLIASDVRALSAYAALDNDSRAALRTLIFKLGGAKEI